MNMESIALQSRKREALGRFVEPRCDGLRSRRMKSRSRVQQRDFTGRALLFHLLRA
jgi:hypothetical protein